MSAFSAAWTRRSGRAISRFRTSLQNLAAAHAPSGISNLIDHVTQQAASARPGADLWSGIAADCRRDLSGLSVHKGTLAQAVDWETLKLQTRLRSTNGYHPDSVPLFRNRHVHIGTLIQLWRRLAFDTETWLAEQGHETLLDIGPWGGFNFVVDDDGYTRMPFARLTLAVGSLPGTPLDDAGGPFFQHLLPCYRAELQAAGVHFPDQWQWQFPKRDQTGRLAELSGTHYLPEHTYDRRTFIKVRLSRSCETAEEITLQDLLPLLERLHFTTDWDLYREQTQPVDARFDLQDFLSLNHVVEGLYQRTAKEERLLNEIKDAYRGAVRSPQVLYKYLDTVIRSGWVENLYWAMAEAALGVKRYQRAVSFDREVCPHIPPRLLIPVRRHLQRYHAGLSAVAPAPTEVTA
jgi:hypothetical protein